MKIEKLNDNQIRCTLTKDDLADRQIKLSELAYGSEKAKALFQDMMQVAAQDFGFEADNTPLVIEAIPISMDSLILIITKVDDPEELDTRFARFSPEAPEKEGSFSLSDLKDRIEGADDILGLIKKISEAKKRAAEKTDNPEKININTATEEDLKTLDGIGDSFAKRIIEYRNENGLFTDISQIMNVNGIGEKTFAKIKDFIKTEETQK